jgi:putative membrane protein
MITMMFWYGGHWAFWQVGLMWAASIVFWGLLTWAAYAVITGLTRKPPDTGHGGDARHILDQRLARGDLSPEEYQRLRGLIETEDQPSPMGTGSTR